MPSTYVVTIRHTNTPEEFDTMLVTAEFYSVEYVRGLCKEVSQKHPEYPDSLFYAEVSFTIVQ